MPRGIEAIDGLFAKKLFCLLPKSVVPQCLFTPPFGRARLWARVKGQQVPEWAKEFDATTWAQFFLKFVASHPTVTCITPATSRAANMADNIGGGVGRLPDEAMRKRMIETINKLPNA